MGVATHGVKPLLGAESERRRKPSIGTSRHAAVRCVAEIEIGTTVSYQGRNFYVRGFTPMGARKRLIYLEDLTTQEWIELDAKMVGSAIYRVPDAADDDDES